MRGVLAFVACAALAVAAPAGAATLFVNGGVAASGDCLSAATACKTIPEAIAKERATPEADSITIAPGTYSGNVVLDQVSDTGLTLQGAGSSADPAIGTIIEGVNQHDGIEATLPASVTVQRLRVVVPPPDFNSGIRIEGPVATISDVAVD